MAASKQPMMSSMTRWAPAAVLLLLATLSGCADLSDDPTMPSGPAASAHPDGWIMSRSDAHHAKALATAGWDMTECQNCHGADYAGGVVMNSCITCHDQGPESCDVCHGGAGQVNSPEDLSGSSDPSSRGVGAHEAHLAASTAPSLACLDCHTIPASFADPMHIDGDGLAEVDFGDRARVNNAAPVYNAETASCANTYCHSGGRFGLNPTVPWNQPETDAGACGSCHALPPGPETEHPQVNATSCAVCHGSVIDADNNFINISLHMNGQANL